MSLILHILPYDLARGAQRYARALVDAMGGQDETHLILTLFRADPVLLRPDVELDVPQGRLRRLGFDPRVAMRLRRRIRSLAPAVVVAHGGESAKYVAVAVPRSIPFVYLKIGTAHQSLGGTGRRGLHSFYTGRASVVAAVSSDVAEEAQRLYGVPRAKLTVIPNARDPEVYQPGGTRGPGDPRVLFVGHLDPGKRPEWFLDVVAELRRRGRRFEAAMVGDGPLLEALRPRAGEVGVELLGRRDDVPHQLARSDVFVFPSLPPGEGMPGVLIEAGLSGLATVSTRVPGASDVIEDGVTGFVVDVEDKGGLVEAADRLVSDRALRVEMGRHARHRCLERFTMAESVRLWRGVLDPLLRSRRA